MTREIAYHPHKDDAIVMWDVIKKFAKDCVGFVFLPNIQFKKELINHVTLGFVRMTIMEMM